MRKRRGRGYHSHCPWKRRRNRSANCEVREVRMTNERQGMDGAANGKRAPGARASRLASDGRGWRCGGLCGVGTHIAILRVRNEITFTVWLVLLVMVFVARSSQITSGYAPRSRLDPDQNYCAILQKLFRYGPLVLRIDGRGFSTTDTSCAIEAPSFAASLEARAPARVRFPRVFSMRWACNPR